MNSRWLVILVSATNVALAAATISVEALVVGLAVQNLIPKASIAFAGLVIALCLLSIAALRKHPKPRVVQLIALILIFTAFVAKEAWTSISLAGNLWTFWSPSTFIWILPILANLLMVRNQDGRTAVTTAQ